jgi:Bacteriophage related domain of unknown function
MSIVKIRAALEVALDAMPGIIPAANIVSSNTSGVFNAPAHGLSTGVNVKIAGHTGSTPAINGSYIVQVIDANNFTLQSTVNQATISLSIGGSGGTVKANLTAWENVAFQTTGGVPYQEPYLLIAKPDNPSFGSPFHREKGIFQINLLYPQQIGTAAISLRAELIRSTFPRGSTFSNGGIDVIIDSTPEISTALMTSGPQSDDRWMLPVKISWYSNIFS